MSVRNIEIGTHFLEQAENANPFVFKQREAEILGLTGRLDRLSYAESLPSEVVSYACGLSVATKTPFAILHHGISYSAAEKAAILEANRGEIAQQLESNEPVLPLKTLTLGVRHHDDGLSYFLVSGVGDFSIDGSAKRAILPPLQQILDTNTNILSKGVVINPPEFDPIYLGVKHGLVSPFLRSDTGLSGFVHYDNRDMHGFVAVAASFNDTVVVRKFVLELVMMWWHAHSLRKPFKHAQRLEGTPV